MHPDRNAQFQHINATAAAFIRRGPPVISVDTNRKNELVRDFKNGGGEWQPTGEPERVRAHDVPGDAVGKACSLHALLTRGHNLEGDSPEVNAFARKFNGRIVTPSDPDYEAARHVWNVKYDPASLFRLNANIEPAPV